MTDPSPMPHLTPRQAEDLFISNLRRLHPDPVLTAAVDRLEYGRGPAADGENPSEEGSSSEAERRKRRAIRQPTAEQD